MRDDAASIVAGLIHLYGIKLQLLDKLLLSESDKLHYCRSGNQEKVIELINTDSGVIDDIDAADFDIAELETSLASLIGVRLRMLYEVLGENGDAGKLISVRNQALGDIKSLLTERAKLGGMLAAASREIRESIDDLSRLSRLKDADAGDIDTHGR